MGGGTKVAVKGLRLPEGSSRTPQCEPNLPKRNPMIILSSAAAFGFIGFVSMIRERHSTAFHNFIWCIVLLFLHYFFPEFPR